MTTAERKHCPWIIESFDRGIIVWSTPASVEVRVVQDTFREGRCVASIDGRELPGEFHSMSEATRYCEMILHTPDPGDGYRLLGPNEKVTGLEDYYDVSRGRWRSVLHHVSHYHSYDTPRALIGGTPAAVRRSLEKLSEAEFQSRLASRRVDFEMRNGWCP